MELDHIKPDRLSQNFNFLSSSSTSSNDRNSLDSGFESLLNLSINDDCSPSKSPRFSFEQKSPIKTQLQHSSPTSPTKYNNSQPQTPNKAHGLILTPIKKQQIADVNGIYYSCIKSPLKSPQNYFNTDTYIRERDTHTANLLRSPALKGTFIETTPVKKIKCKQFVSEEQQQQKQETTTATTRNLLATPTEQEFLELLFKNRHLASHPECLIGRCMGLEFYDILTELNRRSMNNVIDIIFNNLNASDYKNIYHVSKSWRDIIQQDRKRNKERIKYIRFKKKFIESAKENISSPGFIKETLNPKLLKRKLSCVSSNQVFNKLDINCLNNTNISVDLNNSVNNCSVLSANSSKSDNSSYFDFDTTFDSSMNVVDEKMVITDLIHQRNYNNKRLVSSLASPSPLLKTAINRQYSIDNGDGLFKDESNGLINRMNCNSEPPAVTTTKLQANSAKICSKTSRKNLKRL